MGALFGGGSKAAPTPPPKPVATMPDDTDPAVLAAKRAKMADAMAQGGRQSTILTAPTQASPLGASSTIAGSSDYSAKTLGGN